MPELWNTVLKGCPVRRTAKQARWEDCLQCGQTKSSLTAMEHGTQLADRFTGTWSEVWVISQQDQQDMLVIRCHPRSIWHLCEFVSNKAWWLRQETGEPGRVDVPWQNSWHSSSSVRWFSTPWQDGFRHFKDLVGRQKPQGSGDFDPISDVHRLHRLSLLSLLRNMKQPWNTVILVCIRKNSWQRCWCSWGCDWSRPSITWFVDWIAKNCRTEKWILYPNTDHTVSRDFQTCGLWFSGSKVVQARCQLLVSQTLSMPWNAFGFN